MKHFLEWTPELLEEDIAAINELRELKYILVSRPILTIWEAGILALPYFLSVIALAVRSVYGRRRGDSLIISSEAIKYYRAFRINDADL
jgi:hypothetical protein